MNTPTDDELGARLRAALQQVSPLATDPVPPFDEAGRTPDDADVLVLDGARRIRRPRRQLAAAAGVLIAAALAAGATVLITAVSGAGSTAGPAVDAPASGPVRIPLGSTAWRCTAPAGTPIHIQTIRPAPTAEPGIPPAFLVDARDTCVPIPLADSAFHVEDGRVTDPFPPVNGIREGADDDGSRVVGSRAFGPVDPSELGGRSYADELDSLFETLDGPPGPEFSAAAGPYFFGPTGPSGARRLFVADAYLLISHGSQDFIDIYRPGSTITWIEAPGAPSPLPTAPTTALPTATASSVAPSDTVTSPPSSSGTPTDTSTYTTPPASSDAPTDATSPASSGAPTDTPPPASSSGPPDTTTDPPSGSSTTGR